MAQKIVYINDNGGVSVIHPTDNYLSDHTIFECAAKDVPTGKPYKIIDAADLPSREQRSAWTVNPADLTDGVGA